MIHVWLANAMQEASRFVAFDQAKAFEAFAAAAPRSV